MPCSVLQVRLVEARAHCRHRRCFAVDQEGCIIYSSLNVCSCRLHNITACVTQSTSFFRQRAAVFIQSGARGRCAQPNKNVVPALSVVHRMPSRERLSRVWGTRRSRVLSRFDITTTTQDRRPPSLSSLSYFDWRRTRNLLTTHVLTSSLCSVTLPPSSSSATPATAPWHSARSLARTSACLYDLSCTLNH